MPPRRRKTDKHLPPCVYQRHGAYYYVKQGKWTRLAETLPDALAAYASLVGLRQGSMQQALQDALEAARGRVSAGTFEQYAIVCSKLADIFTEFSVEQVRPKHVARVMDAYASKPAVANKLRTFLKLTFELAIRRGLAESNPAALIKPAKTSKRTRYLSDSEYQSVWQMASPAMRVIMDLCYLTGQRISDVLAIELRDCTEDGILIKQQKTGRPLCIAWTSELREVVARAKDLLPDRKIVRLDMPQYLVGQRNGRIRGYQGVRDAWVRACRKAGVRDAHIHDLRAKSLTDADRQGLDAQQLAGHTSAAMTRRYLRDRAPLVVSGPRKVS